MEPLGPCLWFITDKTAKVYFKALIHNFGLPVGLWVIGGTFLETSAMYLENITLKSTQEYSIPVGDDGLGKAVQTNYLLHK